MAVDSATAHITVANQQPSASPGWYSTKHDVPVSGNVFGYNYGGYAYDADGDLLTASVASSPASGGSAYMNGDDIPRVKNANGLDTLEAYPTSGTCGPEPTPA